RIEGVKIAGKTGTAQKLINGEYSKSYYTSSFIGYFPADNPQIVISVIVDAPASGSYYGGAVSAPIFKKIAERIITLTGLQEYSHPKFNEASINYASDIQNQNAANDLNNLYLVNFDISDAVKILKEKNIGFEIQGAKKNAFVLNQEWMNDDQGNKTMKLVTGNYPNESEKSFKDN